MISGPPGAFVPPAPYVGDSDVLAESLMARPTFIVPVPSTAVSVQLVNGPAILAGLTIRENAGAAATFDILDGADATGVLAFSVVLASGGMFSLQMGRDGPYFKSGIFLNRLSGTIKGGLWIKYRV